jgi:hypothetical protein
MLGGLLKSTMNNMPDINIVKYLSVNIKKAFDKGEIDKLYKAMYKTANNIASEETRNYLITFRQKYFEKKFGLDSSESNNQGFLLSKIPEYKSQRIQFHLDHMFKLLELYVKSKNLHS